MASAKTPLVLFSVGPPGMQLVLGWGGRKLLGPFRTLEAALRRRRSVICGPDLEAEAGAAGLPTGPLPAGALQARALFAAHLLWQALLVESASPAAIRALLDAARSLHRRWAGAPCAWSLQVDGRRFDVRLEGTPARCERLLASCEHAPFELELRLDTGPDFAARALADAGWPVVPVPRARSSGQPRLVDPDDLALVTRLARSAAVRLPARMVRDVDSPHHHRAPVPGHVPGRAQAAYRVLV
jgi:hypothetical protein